ncbi:MAG TPA: ECF transporter S component [Candidatus Deferrimicrobium sp.]|nr:ECF transporter S component [Candidatus Deferrimicrobium sp.]
MLNKSTRLSSTKRLTYLAMFIALSAAGANIKIPSIIGTPAFDSLPAFIAGLVLGPVNGAIVAALGHLLTASTAGFPLSIPIHLLIAVGMAVVVAVFALVSRLTIWGGAVVGILMNGILFPAVFILIPSFGKPFFLAMVIPLLVASVLNIVLAEIVFQPLSRMLSATYVKVRKGAAA